MGHEDSVVSNFIAIGLICIGAYYFFQRLTLGPYININDIEIFRTVEESQANIKATVNAQVKPVKKSKVQAARKPKPKPKAPVQEARNSRGYTQLQQDCFDSLKALGIKAVREREFIISNTFNNHNPSTVQDFLKLSLHRGR